MQPTPPSPEDRSQETPGEQPGGGERPVPSEEELLATAQPATVRRAPKFSVFIVVGAIVGIVVGLVLVAVVEPPVAWVADGSGFVPFVEGEGAVRTVVAFGLGIVGGFVGGALAVLADRRSTRRR